MHACPWLHSVLLRYEQHTPTASQGRQACHSSQFYLQRCCPQHRGTAQSCRHGDHAFREVLKGVCLKGGQLEAGRALACGLRSGELTATVVYIRFLAGALNIFQCVCCYSSFHPQRTAIASHQAPHTATHSSSAAPHCSSLSCQVQLPRFCLELYPTTRPAATGNQPPTTQPPQQQSP